MRWRVFAILLGCALCWGANAAASRSSSDERPLPADAWHAASAFNTVAIASFGDNAAADTFGERLKPTERLLTMPPWMALQPTSRGWTKTTAAPAPRDVELAAARLTGSVELLI